MTLRIDQSGPAAERFAAPIIDGATPLFEYLLRLGDADLILAQRLCEWVGKGPAIEEDIALANVGLDLLGQARLWLAYAGETEAAGSGRGRDEDQLAFLRDAHEYRNVLLVEQPNGSYADTTARQFLFDQWHLLVLDGLRASQDSRIAAIASKAIKEVDYHAGRSSDWIIRLGDGTPGSHDRMQAAIDALWPFTGELFTCDAVELELIGKGIACDLRELHGPWRVRVETILREATLATPADGWMQGSRRRGGKQGVHTEHLGPLLAEMQFLQRAYPGAQW